MKVRDGYYSFTAEEVELLKRYARMQDEYGHVTEDSLDTVEMLIEYSTQEE